jgi:hypothetical protein
MYKVQDLGISRIKMILIELKMDCKINKENSRGSFAKKYKPGIFLKYLSKRKTVECVHALTDRVHIDAIHRSTDLIKCGSSNS